MIFFLFLLLWICAGPLHAQQDFVYDDHGKRDPFVPLVSSSGLVITYDQNLSMNDLDLEGIVADPSGNNVALINGKIIKISDTIGPYTVSAITVDHVEFTKDSEKFILSLKKTGGV